MMIRVLLAVLIAAPANAAQIAPRVFRPAAPVRVTPAAAPQLAPRLSALNPLAAPTLQPALTVGGAPIISPVAAPAALAEGAQVRAAAQLGYAAELAAPAAVPVAAERQGAKWSGWWAGSSAVRHEAAPAVKASPSSRRTRLSRSTSKKTAKLEGMGAAGAAAGIGGTLSGALETVRMALDATGPLTQLAGQIWTAKLASGPVARWIGNIGAHYGWNVKLVTFLQRTATAAVYAAAVTAPLTAPAAWAMAAPYASSLGIVWAVKSLDSVIETKLKASPKVLLAAKAAVWFVGGALSLEAAGIAVDVMAQGAWAVVSPYVPTAMAVGGTYVVNKVIGTGIEKFAERAGWHPNTKVLVRQVARIVVWTSGVAGGLAAAGVSSKALMTTFGIGGIAVTMAAKDFIGGFMEAAKLLLLRPFKVGDRIKIGDTEYDVKGLSLHTLELQKAPGTLSYMPYQQAAGKTITVYREYEAKHRYFAGGVKPVSWRDFVKAAKEGGRPLPNLNMGKSALLAVAGLAVVLGLPSLAAKSTMPWLVTALPFLKAGAALWATRWASTWTAGLVTRVAQAAGWDQHASAVVRFIAQTAVWGIGGTVVLAIAGVTWQALLVSVGASAVAIGWATSDIVSNLIQGFKILVTQPYKIGDVVEIGSTKGRIVDMSMNFVVMEHDVELNGRSVRSHTLVPYSVVKNATYTVPEGDSTK